MHEILTWCAGVSSLIGLALSIGMHPATYGATIDMLARKTNWFPRLCWMAAGLVTGATILFVAFQFVNPHRLVAKLEGSVKHALADHVFDLVASGVFLAGAVVVAAWRISRPILATAKPAGVQKDSQMAAYFVIGLSSAIIGFTTLPVMYLTTRVVSGLGDHLAPRAIGYLIFLAVLIAPFFVIAIVWTRAPKLTDRIHAAYERALAWDFRWALAALLGIAGIAALAYAYSVG